MSDRTFRLLRTTILGIVVGLLFWKLATVWSFISQHPLSLQLLALAIGGVGFWASYQAEAEEDDQKRRQIMRYSLGANILVQVFLMISVGAENKLDDEREAKRDEAYTNLLDSVTGGKSYCYIECRPSNYSSNRLVLTLRHSGDHPLYDVKVVFDDTADLVFTPEFRQMNPDQRADQLRTRRQPQDIGTLYSYSVSLAPLSLPTNRVNGYLNWTFTARNSFWRQSTSYYRSTNGIKFQTVVQDWGRRNHAFPPIVFSEETQGYDFRELRNLLDSEERRKNNQHLQ